MEFKDERSSLIKYYFHILEKLKPKYFLLENVYMSDKCEQYISNKLNGETNKNKFICVFSPKST